MFTADYATHTGWTVVETTLIMRFLGAEALGLWSVSFMLLEAANKAAQAITAVYIPRVFEVFGRTERVRDGMTNSSQTTATRNPNNVADGHCWGCFCLLLYQSCSRTILMQFQP